jgi:hypothetical protein
MRRFFVAVSAVAALAFAAGCNGDMGNDAGTDNGPGLDASDVTSDTPTDTRNDAPADAGNLFRACTTNADCGAGLRCNNLFPGGLCTRSCTNDRACNGGVCDMNLGCLPSCTPHGGLECDQYGSACYPYDAEGTQFVCIPSCFPTGTTPPASYTNMCITGTMCDPQTELCTATTSMGAPVGDPCTANGDCASGRCIQEVDEMTGMATGFLGGQCYGVGRLPDGAAYMGTTLPQSNCPPNSVAIPFENTDAEGDPAICLRSCMTDTDCGRAGYFCEHFQNMMGMPAFTNGICNPIDCNESGRTCPTGYHCVTDPSDAAMPPGHCEAGGTDGGVTTDVPAVDVPAVDVVTDVPAVDATIGD